MKRKGLTIILVVFIIISLSAKENVYKKIMIPKANREIVNQLQQLGIALEGVSGITGEYIEIIICEKEKAKLEKAGIDFEILIEDMTSYYQSRFGISDQIKTEQKIQYEVPENFNFGSMGGYLTFDEVVAELDSMYQLYPNLITARTSIGNSIENRDLWMVKISVNPSTAEDEPQVLYTALHHSREPQSLMTILYTMWYLLENYNSNDEITQLVNSREMYFIPVVNPDGYVYNRQIAASGGGLWRKNKRDNNNDGEFEPDIDGVDLNRNYDHNWGYDDQGSSPDMESLTYRGTKAFSEPETEAIRQFVNGKNFKTVLNYHTYGNYLIHPFGFDKDSFPSETDLAALIDYSKEMFSYNGYTFGNCFQTLNYLSNGLAEDWYYGEQTEKPKIFAICPEVGSNNDGFWPATDRIIPLADENLIPNIFFAQVAGSIYRPLYVQMSDTFLNPGETVNINLEVQNIGLTASSGEVRVEITTTSPYFSLNIPTLNLGTIAARATTVSTETAQLSASSSTPVGYKGILNITFYEAQQFICEQEYEIQVGTPELIFADDAENGMTNWTVDNQWGTIEDAYEGNYSFSDSPDGEYENNQTGGLTLQQHLDLSDANDAYLEFWTKWQLEGALFNIPGDFAQVEILAHPDSSWQAMEGRYTSLGLGDGVQALDEPGYAKNMFIWVNERMELTDFIGNSEVKIRFNLSTDGVNFVDYGDGWYIDNIAVYKYAEQNNGTGNPSGFSEMESASFHVFPNPTTGKVEIHSDGTDILSIRIFDITGNILLEKLSLSSDSSIDLSDYDGNIFFIRVQKNDETVTTKIVKY